MKTHYEKERSEAIEKSDQLNFEDETGAYTEDRTGGLKFPT